MSLSLKNQFKERQEFAKHFGVVGVRIVTDAQGMPIVNPTNAQLEEVLPGFTAEGKEEKVYASTQKVTWGWTATQANGGKQRISAAKAEELAPMDRDNYIEDEEVKVAKVTFVVETLDNAKMRKLVTFRFFDSPTITKDGSKVRVFNKFGKTTYLEGEDNYGSESFESGLEDNVTMVPLSAGGLGFDHLMDFLYAYSTVNRKIALFEDFEVDTLFAGDVSGIVDIINVIHSDIVDDKDNPLYGATMLFTVENNNGTGNEFRQSYYTKFERYFLDMSGKVNKEFPGIMKAITRDRKPQSNGKTYSPESKGIFIGINGVPQFGLKEFKASMAKGLLNIGGAPTSPMGGAPAMSDSPFGGGGDAPVFG